MNYCFVRDSVKVRAAIEFKIRTIKITDAELARRVGCQKGLIGRWRRGERAALSQARVVKLAACLGIELDLTVKYNT